MIRPMALKVSEFLRGLTPRERYAVYAGTAVVLIFIFWKAVAVPMADRRESLDAQLAARQNDLNQMTALQREYDGIRQTASLATAGRQSRGPDFTLFSFLDRLAGNAGIKEFIAYMRPSVSGKAGELSIVEMKLEGVSLQGLVSFLHMVETSDTMVFVTRLSVATQEKGTGGVEAVLRVETVTS
ncbi:MAG: type II secretion system protein GspM [Thermodesulfobacteriota bacterium]